MLTREPTNPEVGSPLLIAFLLFPFTTTAVAWLMLGFLVGLNWLIGAVLSVIVWVWSFIRIPYELFDRANKLRKFATNVRAMRN